MKNYNLLSIILLGVTIVCCKDPKKNAENLFRFDDSKFKPQYYTNDVISLEILNPENKKIDSIVYYTNDKKIASKKDSGKVPFELKEAKLGYQNLKAIIYYDGETAGQETTSRIEVVSSVAPKLLKYTIVNTFAHDTLSFTEGFEFIKDTLYESTGSGETGSGGKTKSFFRKYDYKTGKIYKQVDMDPQYFGEGITMINNKIYQLTWQSMIGFIYNANTLKMEKTFTFDKKIEGWGMTNDGKSIYQSDGTEKIWRMNPEDQKMIDYVNVYSGKDKIKSVNELEWINGKIYANIWQKDAIAVINPATGSVEGILNMAALKKLVTNKYPDVLNGIAYNPKTKTVFVTGKNWNKIFELKISE